MIVAALPASTVPRKFIKRLAQHGMQAVQLELHSKLISMIEVVLTCPDKFHTR